MNYQGFEIIPEALHDTARAAIGATFGAAAVTVTAPITGGASGALAFRLQAGARDYAMRIENRRSPLRNPHQYTCMRIAADAGISPQLHHADDGAGVLIMDFVQQQPLSAYPGGPAGLATALGKLARRLQETEPFPVLGDYRVFIERLLTHLRTLVAPGLLDVHYEAFMQIRNVCPWDAAAHVSSHNDPNPRNILFDGERLWLIDWETSYRNEALLDVAVLVENCATTPELEALLVQAWLGRAPDATLQARLLLMRLMTRMYYAGLLTMLSVSPQQPLQDINAPTPEQFKAMLVSGQLNPASAETRITLAKMLLASFAAGVESPQTQAALASFA